MKKIVAIALALMLVMAVTGCASPTTGTESAPPSESSQTSTAPTEALKGDLSDVTIGACVMSLQHEFMINLVEGYDKFKEMTNVNVVLTDGGNMEPEKQVTAMENYITQGVDGIIVQCVSIDTMKDVINRAMDAGIPVGYYPHADGVKSVTYFNYDEYAWGHELGIEAAKWINEKLGGKAKIINVQTSIENQALQRVAGWTDYLNETIGADNIEWVTVEATSSEDAMANVESALQANPDTDMVLIFNDEMGVGAYQAVIQSGLDTTNMFVGSCDGTDTVLDFVQEDTVYRCTIGNDRFVSEIGFYWIQNMAKCVLGMDYDDPFPITTIAITKDNVDAYRNREPEYKLDPEIVEYMNTH
jgi:ABC-type sugar transport system substrate-binding protein